MKESKPEEVIQVMESYSEEDESNFSFLELLSGSSYSLIDVIDETIATSIQNVADAVEKKAKTTAKKVNKSAKKGFAINKEQVYRSLQGGDGGFHHHRRRT